MFYFHGVNCVPLYGAEQSNWMDVADRENLIVVFPAPARSKCWNIFDLPVLPSDMDFVLALVEHMNQVHPIDEAAFMSRLLHGRRYDPCSWQAPTPKFCSGSPL